MLSEVMGGENVVQAIREKRGTFVHVGQTLACTPPPETDSNLHIMWVCEVGAPYFSGSCTASRPTCVVDPETAAV